MLYACWYDITLLFLLCFKMFYRVMDSLPVSPEVTYNWVDITSDFFKHIEGIDCKITV